MVNNFFRICAIRRHGMMGSSITNETRCALIRDGGRQSESVVMQTVT
jgi:hypothetical protein